MASDLKIIRVSPADLATGIAAMGLEDPARLAVLAPHVAKALLSNPLNQEKELPVQLLGVKGCRVIGRLDLYAGQASIRNEIQQVAWGSGLFVDPEYRLTKMGVMLVGELAKLGDISAGCGVAQIALPLYKLLNFVDLRMSRYILLRRSRSVVERLVGISSIASVVRVAADASLLVHRGVMRAWTALAHSGLSCEPVDLMDESLAAEFIAGDKSAFFHRSPTWVNWVLSYNPSSQLDSKRGVYLIRRNSSIVGYFLIRKKFYPVATHREFKNLTLGTVGDFGIFKPDQLSPAAVNLLACRELSRWDVDAVEVCSSDAALGSRLRRMGFLPAGDLHLMFKPRKDSPAASPEFKDVANWRIAAAEGDNFLE